MDFLEAVQAMSSGKCEGIKRASWTHADYLRPTFTYWKSGDDWSIKTHAVLADDWKLVNPTPQTERVEVKRWGLISDGGNMRVYNTKDEAIANKSDGWNLVEFTGHFDRPIPRKVKRRVDLGNVSFSRHEKLISFSTPVADRPDEIAGTQGRVFYEYEVEI